MNQFLLYFPLISVVNGAEVAFKDPTILPDYQICDILNLAKKSTWTEKMMESNADPYDMDLQELVEYLERLEIVENLRSFNKSTDRERNPKRKRNESKQGDKGKMKPCKHCDKVHAGKCWFGPGGKYEGKKKTDGAKSSKKSAKQHPFTVEEFQEL